MAQPRIALAWLVGLIALVAIALALPELLEPGGHEAARRAQCVNNLKGIGIALHNYHEAHGEFPAGTVANPALAPEQRLSWQTLIARWVAEHELIIDWSKGWADAANRVPLLKGAAHDPTTHRTGDAPWTHPP